MLRRGRVEFRPLSLSAGARLGPYEIVSPLGSDWVNADGTGEVARLHEGPASELPLSWHPSGKFLTYAQGAAGGQGDTMILPMDGDAIRGWTPGKPFVFLNTPGTESYAMFSPDGRWLAYTSNESGTIEVYVRPFPGPGGKTQISSGGGNFPTWSHVRPELLYGTAGRIMVTAFTVDGNAFHAGSPALWSEGRFQTRGLNRMFDLHPDGDRVALAPSAPAGALERARQLRAELARASQVLQF